MKKINRKHRKYGYIYVLCITVLTVILCARKTDLGVGIEAIKKGDYLKAIKSLNVALSKDSLNSEIHYHLSVAYANLDSVNKSFHHYMMITESDSNWQDKSQLKELLARFLDLDPYPSKNIPMKRMNQFKGVIGIDGKTIAVAAAKRDVANIYLMQLDGTIIKRITDRGMNTDPDFSPSGDHIIFISDQDGDDELYLYNIKSKQTEKLTDNTAQDLSPSFSPNGDEIVFVSNMDDEFKWEIYKINIVNKKIKRLTKNEYWDGFPKFSSDGRSIVFSSKRSDSENIYIIKAGGGGEKVLYESPADDNDPQLVNEYLYFKSNRDGEWELYRFNINNKELMRLTNNNSPDWNPRVSEDGSKILASRKSKNRWQLYYIDFNKPIATETLTERIRTIIEPEESQ